MRTLVQLLFVLVLASASTAVVHTQGVSTSTLAGVVVDSNGGVIPGATVVVKNVASEATFEVVTNSTGLFAVPALNAGTYSVSVSLTGFKTAVVNDVRVLPGTPANVKVALAVGSIEETITVQGSSSEIVNTQTATVSSTLNVDQINRMPLATRNAINAVAFLPGVNTPTNNRNSNFNGLPDSFVAISLDGVNNNENYNKSTEGLFAMVTPRQDAVEAVTVTTAVGGADIGGHGAVQISFVTRSGTNRFTGSAYEYFRHPSLNSNYWFNKRNNLPRNDVVLNQYGGRQGGPIVIPGLYDGRGKAFFFVNYEELRLPNNFTRTRDVLTPEALAGRFRYNVTVGGQNQVREVDLLQLAVQNGQLVSLDPLVMQVLGSIRSATQASGVLNPSTDPNVMDYVWQSPGRQYEKQPVVRIDYNLASSHRLSGTLNWQTVVRDPDQLNGDDPRFPGFANHSRYASYRKTNSVALRSTLGRNVVNELRGGIKYGPSIFGQNIIENGLATFDAQEGLALSLPLVTDPQVQNGYTGRSAWSWNIDNTLNWQKGAHNVSFGASAYFGYVWEENQTTVPTIEFGVADADPADAMFNSRNFPGASSGELDDARDLYAMLTGRVISYDSNAALDSATTEYGLLGKRRREGRMNDYSVFVQDSWRVTPTLTLNGGLRWGVQMPFEASNDIMATSFYADACGISGIGPDGVCRFFQPGASAGVQPTYVQFDSGVPGWKTDWNNLAPNASVAWRPNVQSGWLRSLLGDPEQATLRAGYSVAYDRQGMQRFVSQYGANPGSLISLERNEDNGLLAPPGASWPVLLRDTARLGPATFDPRPSYPIAARPNRQDDVSIFHPNLKVSFARSWTVSFQRALSKNTAIDIRYVGTRGVNQWSEENYNELNLIENGFVDEFRVAMANLRANQQAGLGSTFAYTGAPGTAPLPIYLAYFSARPSSQAGNPASYTGSSWTNSTFVNRLAPTNPNPVSAANDLDGNAGRRGNALRAGLPANFFVVNPAVDDVFVWDSGAFSDYNALQIEVRRRLSDGLQINGSYQYALEGGSIFLGRHFGRVTGPTPNVRHAFKAQWDWSLPVGRGRRFGGDMHPILDGLVGGWQFNGVGRVQARTINLGSVRLVGMTVDELTKEYRYRIDPETGIVTALPDDIILNTRRAFSTDATSPTGYSALGVPEGRYIAPANSATCIELKVGDCGPRAVLVKVPFFTRFDIGLSKRFPVTGRVNLEFRVEVLNAFDNINFNPVAPDEADGEYDDDDLFQVNSAYTDLSNTFDPGGRLGQIMFRVNW